MSAAIVKAALSEKVIGLIPRLRRPFSRCAAKPSRYPAEGIRTTGATDRRLRTRRLARPARPGNTALGLAAGERLSLLSSGLPWLLVSQDGVEDGEELAGDGDEGDHVGLSGGAEAFAEGFEDGVV